MVLGNAPELPEACGLHAIPQLKAACLLQQQKIKGYYGSTYTSTSTRVTTEQRLLSLQKVLSRTKSGSNWNCAASMREHCTAR